MAHLLISCAPKWWFDWDIGLFTNLDIKSAKPKKVWLSSQNLNIPRQMLSMSICITPFL